MEDFGETLVDIRERMADVLPLRVRWWPVFSTALLETFALMTIKLIRSDFRLSALSHSSVMLTPFEEDIAAVITAFQPLRDRQCTSDQFIQARNALDTVLARYHSRWLYEQNLWIGAVKAGMFLGVLLSTLLMVSSSLCLITDHRPTNLYLLMAFILSQGVVATVCVNGWHRRWL